ncbi:hypothetical protein CRE_31600 [Caenorhabditis remanei]|uniref:F-box domain-containing protein n=1 Tax=Caenorhabditis remanei TaxID=31234 RepID=E3NR67_CAERE|nr:hypothetical protein CRE_31600 [Caenorhabditis remanei]
MRSFRINFSIISKRTKALTKKMTFYSQYSIQLSIDDDIEVWVIGPKYMTACCYIFTPNEKMNGKVAENTYNDCNELHMWKCSNNLVDEWKQLCKHVLDIFKIQTIDYLSMIMDAFVDQNVSIIDILIANVKSVNRCDVYQSEENNDVDEHVAYLLENIKINDNLHNYLQTRNDSLNSGILQGLKELHIVRSEWIRYEILLEIDSKIVILTDNRISDEEWNLFFKKWIAMKTNQNLEYLELDTRELDRFRDRVLYGIPHEVVDEGVKRLLKTRRTETQEISGGIDIRRTDGKTATFFVIKVISSRRCNEFPILGLPFLAFEEIFKAMHPIEIISFSMISKRARTVTKLRSFYSKYSVHLFVENFKLFIGLYGTNEMVACTYIMTSEKHMDGKIEEKEHNERMQLKYRELDIFRDCVLYDIPHEVVHKGVKRTLISFPEPPQSLRMFSNVLPSSFHRLLPLIPPHLLSSILPFLVYRFASPKWALRNHFRYSVYRFLPLKKLSRRCTHSKCKLVIYWILTLFSFRINFSMISKRTKTVTKHMNFFSKYSIGIDIDEEQQVSVVGPEYITECVYIFTSNEEMNGKVVEEGDWDDMNYELRAWKYSNNPVEEWMQLLKHVLDIFQKQSIDSLSMTMDAFVDQNVSIIDFLKSNVKSVDNCNLYQLHDETNVDDHSAYLLKNITISSTLFSLVKIKNNNFNLKIPKNLKELTILESKWIGYERLLEIDCKSVILEKNRISDEQWNSFFKKWIAMETNQNLEYLELKYRVLEEFRDLVLHDIPYEVVSEEISRIVTW